jgi:hypothetical protein
MAFALKVTHPPEFLLLEARGLATLADLCGVFGFVRAAATNQGQSRALMDLSAVEIHFAFTDHLVLGAQAASELNGLKRVASVVDPKFRVGTSEKVAQKMGLTFRTFVDRAEAETWLVDLTE